MKKNIHKRFREYINDNTCKILITLVISIIILYFYPNLLLNADITSVVRATFTGVFIGLCISKLQHSKLIDGHLVLNCYMGITLALSLMRKNNNILNVISYFILIICIYYLVGEIIKNKKSIIKNKSIIIELLSLLAGIIALTIQILDFANII